MAKAKQAEQAAAVVYCGPTIPGVANQYTTYTNGIPRPLAEAIKEYPPMQGLVVTLDQLPDAMKKLHGKYGHLYRLYCLVQAKTNRR